MRTHPPRAFPLGGSILPWAPSTLSESPTARPEGADRAPRLCMRKGCGRTYQPRCWNQRYCQEPEWLRQVRKWQAAKRQAKHRQDAEAKVRHAQAERERRERAKRRPRPLNTQRLRRRVVTQQNLFFHALVRSARLSRTPRELTPQPGTVLWPCLPSGGSQRPGSRTQVALSRHLGWSSEAGDRVSDRTPASRASPLPRRWPGTIAATPGVTIAFGVRRSSIIALPSWRLVSWAGCFPLGVRPCPRHRHPFSFPSDCDALQQRAGPGWTAASGYRPDSCENIR